MSRRQLASLITGAAALGFFLTAALALSSYGSVAESGRQSPADVGPLLSALWLTFTAALVVLGLMVALEARSTAGRPGPLLFLAACFPLVAGALMLSLVGSDSAGTILLGLGVLTLIGAALRIAAPRAGQPIGG